MNKQTILVIALLSNSVFAQNLPNYISVNNSNVPQIATNAAPNQVQQTPQALASPGAQGSPVDMNSMMESVGALNAKAAANHDVTAGLSAKDKAEFIESMDKVKKLQETSKQMQDQMANEQNMSQGQNKQQQQQQQPAKIAKAIKRVEKPALKDVYIYNISGWNTTTIDEYTSQGKENLEKRYTEFLSK